MAATYEPISTTTLSSAAASITFSSISGAYTDLRLIFVGTISSAAYAKLQINSDTGANYSSTGIKADPSTLSGNQDLNANYIWTSIQMDTTIPNFVTYEFFSYAGSSYKPCLVSSSLDTNGAGASISRLSSLWRNTSAITSLTLNANGGTFSIGTTATLYGILKA